MHTAALTLPAPAPDHQALLHDMTERTHDLIAENARLTRDLKSARVTRDSLLRAMKEGVKAGPTIAIARETAVVGRLLDFARIAEAAGEVPMVRLARDEAGHISGIELALLERAESPDTDYFAIAGDLCRPRMGLAVTR